MKELVYERIDKHVIVYAKNPVKPSDLVITPETLFLQRGFNNTISIFKDDYTIQVIVAPTIHELLSLNLEEQLLTTLVLGEICKFNRFKIFFRIPKNHPLLFEQIKTTKALISDLHYYFKIRTNHKNNHMNYQIKMLLDKEITFGKINNTNKITCTFKNGTFELIKHTCSKYHRFLYDKEGYSNKQDDELLSYLKSNTPKAILDNFKTDKELLNFFKKEYIQTNNENLKQKSIKLDPINITTDEKNLDKLKENITKTITETFGVDEEHVHVKNN